MPRKPFRTRPYRAAVGETDAPVFSRATVLDNGLIGEKPRSKAELERSAAVPSPALAENDLYALNSLQLKRGRCLESLTVQIPMEYLHHNLPLGARNMIGIATCGSPYVFCCAEGDADRRIRKAYRRWREFWDIFRGSEYVFWPVEAERGYFVTAIFHMEKGLINDPDFDADADPTADIPQVPNPNFGLVGAWSVVDPGRGATARDRVTRVKDRIQRIFAVEGITFGAASYREQEFGDGEKRAMPWVPPLSAVDDWSSGIRSFVLVRQMMQRALDLYCSQAGFEDRFFSEPTCGWLNVDQVRYEMMGICATNTLEDMNWNARLAIECIERIGTVEGLPTFQASRLAPNNTDKHAYVPASDENGSPKRVP